LSTLAPPAWKLELRREWDSYKPARLQEERVEQEARFLAAEIARDAVAEAETETLRRVRKPETKEAAPLAIEPGKLYPLPALEEALAGTMTLKTFLERLKLDATGRGRMFQYAVWGHEILRAMRDIAEGAKAPETPQEAYSATAPRLPRKPGRPRKQPVAAVHELAGKAGSRR
jgi:hypothetical protein